MANNNNTTMNDLLRTMQEKHTFTGEVQFNVLEKLAGQQDEKDDLSELVTNNGLSNTAIGEAIASMKAKEAEEETKAAAAEVLKLLKMTDAVIRRYVSEIRLIRREEQIRLARLGLINRAQKYAAETSDYRPLFKAIGITANIVLTDSDIGLPEEAKAPAKRATAVKK